MGVCDTDVDMRHRTPFFNACSAGNIPVMDWLVAHGVSPSNLTWAGTHHHRISLRGHIGSRYMYVDEDGESMFKRACSNGNVRMLDWLVSHGLPLTEMTRAGLYLCLSWSCALCATSVGPRARYTYMFMLLT